MLINADNAYIKVIIRKPIPNNAYTQTTIREITPNLANQLLSQNSFQTILINYY